MSVACMTWAWKQKGISAPAKLALLALADHADDEGICWPGTKHLAEKCNLSRSVISRHMATLIVAGLIIAEHRQRVDGSKSSNRYYLQMNVAPMGGACPPDIHGCPPDIHTHDLQTYNMKHHYESSPETPLGGPTPAESSSLRSEDSAAPKGAGEQLFAKVSNSDKTQATTKKNLAVQQELPSEAGKAAQAIAQASLTWDAEIQSEADLPVDIAPAPAAALRPSLTSEAAPAPPGKRRAKPVARPKAEAVAPTVTPEFRDRMREKYRQPLGTTVDELIDDALNHKAVLKAINVERYVQGWLRRDAERLAAGGRQPAPRRPKTGAELRLEMEAKLPPIRQPRTI